MEEMKIHGTTLDKLIGDIKGAGFDEKYSLTAGDRIWTMYIKPTENVLKVTYVNDHCEIMSTETFKGIEDVKDEAQEKENVEGIIDTYRTGMKELREASKPPEIVSIGVPALCALIGIGFGKSIATGIIGGMMGLLFNELIKTYRMRDIGSKLDNYLDSHNIYVGQKALDVVKSDYAQQKLEV